jgi:DinB superfamily
MTKPDAHPADLRTGLIDSLRAARETEAAIFDALDPAERERPGADGGWSAKDILAHLSAWRQRETDVLAAHRRGDAAPHLPGDGIDGIDGIDEINANFHALRADWSWDRVAADAEATATAFIAEVTAASDDTLADPKVVGYIMGDGLEHDLGHLGAIATAVGRESDVLALADTTLAILDRGGWPDRPGAVVRYNLACFHALAGNLDVARSLLRQVLPEQEDLRTLASTDDDLIALRDEIPTLGAG